MHLDLDQQIDSLHRQLESSEAEAQAILSRIRQVPGCSEWGKRNRPFGKFPNPFDQASSNLTVQSALIRHNRPLAQFLAAKAGASLPSDEAGRTAQEQRHAQLRAMEQKTAELRQQNEARRLQQERQRTHGWFTNGRWVV